jgi:hypothetical protein
MEMGMAREDVGHGGVFDAVGTEVDFQQVIWGLAGGSVGAPVGSLAVARAVGGGFAAPAAPDEFLVASKKAINTQK